MKKVVCSFSPFLFEYVNAFHISICRIFYDIIHVSKKKISFSRRRILIETAITTAKLKIHSKQQDIILISTIKTFWTVLLCHLWKHFKTLFFSLNLFMFTQISVETEVDIIWRLIYKKNVWRPRSCKQKAPFHNVLY